LTALGKEQAEATSCYLSGQDCNALIKNPDTIFVSPFLRTLQTSAPTTHKLPDAQVVVWDDIFEVGGCHKDGKSLGGLTKGDVKKQFGYDTWYKEPSEAGWYNLPSKESKDVALMRIKGVAKELTSMAAECEKEVSGVGVELQGRSVTAGSSIRLSLSKCVQFLITPQN
jgi:broad specificity phosphatase PhoE